MDKITKWLIRISVFVIIGYGFGYLEQAIEKKEALRFRKTIKYLNCLKPKYLKEALMRGITGSTSIKIFINKDGTISDAIIQNSSGYLYLDNAALDTARGSTFNLIERDGDILIKYEMKLGI